MPLARIKHGIAYARQPVRIARWGVAVAVLLGVAVGAVVVHQVDGARADVPHPVTGTVTAVDEDGTALGFRADDEPHGGTTGYALGPVDWIDSSGTTHLAGTHPSCLAPLSHGQHVELWLLDVRDANAGPRQVITRVRCLSD
ncbi:hypothetical protein AB0I55_07435 [Actinocatenispora sera]|uniref:hypothetical protein n=1 Tax=Actinocatenispora sera TaxID=390989 RepID=UPI0033E5D8BB